MDLDRYIARNEPGWARLEHLTRQASRGVGRLEPAEVDELVALYQRTSAQLSHVRSYVRDPALVARLTNVVATANGLIYRRRTRSWRAVGRFFTLGFPGAVHHCRRHILVAALAFLLPALVFGFWLSNDADMLDRTAPPRERREYVEERFESYYSEQSPLAFFTLVTTNNIQVSFVCYATGAVSGGLGSVVMVAREGARLGVVAAWMLSEGDLARFFGFIVPHGALELTSIVFAAGAGLAVGWSVIAPGDRRRSEALRDEGQRSITILLGIMTMFVVAGLVEGFITGRGLPPAARVGIGVLVWLAFLGYLAVRGPVAAAAGVTGLLGEQARTWADEPDRWEPVGAS